MIDLNLTIAQRMQQEPEMTTMELIKGTIVALGLLFTIVLFTVELYVLFN